MRGSHLFAGLLCYCVFTACSVTHEAGNFGPKQLYHTIDSDPVFQKHHFGFALYDPADKQWICQYNAGKYFTPASNTKILTLLTALEMLPDTVESLRYVIHGDSMILMGMADPSFLWPDLDGSAASITLMRNFPGDIFLLPSAEVTPFGPGWGWDDYPFDFQVERSQFPIHGNRVYVTLDADGELHVMPAYFASYFQADTSLIDRIDRDFSANAFTVNPVRIREGDTLAIPFIYSDYDAARILSETLDRNVQVLYNFNTTGEEFNAVNGLPRDTLLKRLMQISDNFIAEQLMMQCAFYLRGTFEVDTAIRISMQTVLKGIPDPVQWVDGSGLSRYNLCSPRDMVWTLDRILAKESVAYITSIFPAGGKSGTISRWYVGDPPYVYAKTGTLRNQHCLSGYLRTDKGKWLIFSFMHNNFTEKSDRIKLEMERVLIQIKKTM